MPCYAIVRAGVCHQVVCCDESMLPPLGADEVRYEVDALSDATDLYLQNGIIHKKPTPPSTSHRWSDQSLSWVPDAELAWREVRQRRQIMLLKSDWTQLSDVPLLTKDAWAEYRQALRDVTSQPDPFTIQWPKIPE